MSISRTRFLKHCFQYFTDGFWTAKDMLEHMIEHGVTYTPSSSHISRIIKSNCSPGEYETTTRKRDYYDVLAFRFKKQLEPNNHAHVINAKRCR